MAQTVVIDITARFTDETSKGLNKASKSADKLGDSLRKTQKQIDKIGNSKSDIKLELKDKAFQSLNKISKGVKDITSKTWNLTVKVLDKATAPIRGIFNLLKNPIVQAGAILGIGVGAKDTFDTYTGFEKSMSNVKALTGASDTEMGILTTKAREEGRTTTKSASEVADAMGYMALAGWDKDTILKTIHPTLRLSEAADMEMGRTTDLVTDSMSSLGLKPEQLEDYLDKVAKTSSKSNTDIDKLMESFLEIGGTVKQNNIPLEEATGLVGVLANRGVKGSEAGVALNSVLMNLSTGAGQAGKAMSELGLSAFNSDGSFKGYAQTLKELNDRTKDMTDEQKSYYLGAIGGKMRLTDLQKLLSGVSEEYDQLKDNIIDSKGALEEMARTKNDNIYGDMKALQSAVDDVKIGLMTKLQPDIRKFIQWLTSKVPDVSKAVDRASDMFLEKVDNMKKKIQDFTSTSEWQNADFFGKISISWDNLIAEPFGQWWDSTGKSFFADKASGIGEGIGKGITNGLLVLLGFDIQGAAEDGISIGTSFAEGFSKGFDGKKIGEAFLNAIKGVFKDAGTFLPGGEKASGTSGLSAALLAFLGFKAGKAGYGVFKGVSSIFGGGNKSGLGSLMGQSVATNTMNVAAAVVNISGGLGRQGIPTMGGVGGTTPLLTGGGSAIAGKYIVTSSGGVVAGSTNSAIIAGLANTGYGLGSGASTIGGAAAVGGASIAGVIGGTVGISAGLYDFYQGYHKTGKAQKDEYVQGGTKIGMVGAGAAAGAGIGAMFGGVGAIPGALIGAGIGGVSAILSGNKVGKWLSDLTDGTRKVNNAVSELKKTSEELTSIKIKTGTTDNLVKSYEELDEKINNGKLSAVELEDAERKRAEVVKQLHDLYPEIVTQYDVANDKLSNQLDTIKEISEIEAQTAKIRMQNTVEQSMKSLPDLEKNIKKSKETEGKLENKRDNYLQEKSNLDSFNNDIKKYEKEYELAIQSMDFDKQQEISDKLSEIVGQINNYFSSLDNPTRKELSSMGFTGFYQNYQDYEWNYGKSLDKFAELDEKISAQRQETKELETSYNEIYEQAKQYIELDLNGTLEENAKNFDKLDDSQKDLFQKALGEYDELIAKMDLLPESKVVRINFETISTPKRPVNENGVAMQGPLIGEKFSIAGKYAQGGLITKPHVGLIGEAGPEVIIPLSGANKGHGINLWQKTGELLGLIPKHAQGGIFGNTVNLKNTSNGRNSIYDMLNYSENNLKSRNTEPQNVMQNNNPISINLGGINFTFNGTGTMDKESIMQIIREQMPEIADEVAETIAEALKKLFPNMKVGVI